MDLSYSRSKLCYKLEKTEIQSVSHFDFDFTGIQGCITAMIMGLNCTQKSHDCNWNHLTYIITTWPKLDQTHPDIYKYPICMPNYQQVADLCATISIILGIIVWRPHKPPESPEIQYSKKKNQFIRNI